VPLCSQSTDTLAKQEFNRAFVLMQYFGYLRRNPNDLQDSDYTGYDFRLTQTESVQRQLHHRRDGESLHHLDWILPTLRAVSHEIGCVYEN